MNNDYVKDTPICDNNSIIKDEEYNKSKNSETKIPEQDINHMEEVIVGTEQGTTFPMKMVQVLQRVVLVKNIIRTYP